MVERVSWLAALLLAGCVFDGGVAPVPHDDHARTAEDTPIEIAVLDNDYGDHDMLEFARFGGTYINSKPSISTSHGRVELNHDDTFLYTPEHDFYGNDKFFYVVGNRGVTARAQVTVEVTPDSEQFGDPIALYASDLAMVAVAAELGGAAAPDLIVEEGDAVVALERGEGLALRVAQVIGERGCCSYGSGGRSGVVGCCSGREHSEFVVADFDGNGQSDLVRFGTQHTIELLLAQPAEGGVGVRYDVHPIDYFGPDAIALDRDLADARPRRGAAGDFDGDGELDLAVGFDGSPGLIVHLGMGSGTPRASRVIDGTGELAAIASGDLDADGIADIVMLTSVGAIAWIRGDRNAPLRLASGAPRVAVPYAAVLLVGNVDGLPGDEVVMTGSGQATMLARVTSGCSVRCWTWCRGPRTCRWPQPWPTSTATAAPICWEARPSAGTSSCGAPPIATACRRLPSLPTSPCLKPAARRWWSTSTAMARST